MGKKPTYEDLEQKIETLEKRGLFGEGDHEKKYRLIVETLPQGVQEVDTSGKIIFANSSYHRMLGYENGELIGRVMYEMQSGVQKQKELRDYVQILVQQQPQPEPYFAKLAKKNGRIIDVRTDWNYKRNEQGDVSGFISIITDITESKRTEDALKRAHEELEMRVEKRTEQLVQANARLFQSEKKYRLIAENAADVIWMLDPENQTFTYVSPSVERMLGFTDKEAINRDLAQMVTPSSLEYIQRTTPIRIERMLQGDTSFFTDEIEIIHKDGHVVPTEINMRFVKNQLTGLVEATGVMRDITERRQAEETLKESEARFRNMFDNAAFGIIICRLIRDDTGTPIDFEHLKVNSATQRHTGFQTHQLLGKRASEIVSPEEAANLTGRYAQVVATRKPYGYERHFPVYDRTLDVGAFHLDDDLFVLTFIDISQRKKAEEALRRSEERFRLAFENANIGVCLVDKGGVFLNVNHRMCDIFGYGRNEFEGMKVNDLTHPEDQNISPKFIEKGVSGEVENAVFEKRYFHKNGSLIWGQVSSSVIRDEKGDPLCFISHVQDITKPKQAEEALQESELQFKSTFEQAAVGICHADPSGRFLKVNQRFLQIVGYDRNEISGLTWQSITHPDDLNADLEKVEQVLKNRLKTYSMEKRFIKKDGVIVWVNLTVSLVRKPNGSPFYFIGVIEDLSERKKMEAQLQQTQKMEAIGNLAGGIAHDFNNILAIILGNAELASDDIPASNPANENLEEIRLASIRAKEMIRQLLAFSRKSDQKNRPVDIAPIIKESMKMLRSAVPSNVEFETYISDDPCSIQGDVAQINQIMMNLVTNAAQAMSKEGGILKVTLSKIVLQMEKPCFNWVLSPGTYARLTIRDTGEGMAPEIVDRIFDPYFTTKDVGKGTGMGLSVVHGIVKRHKGGIQVKSEPGKGTAFEVFFPVLETMVEEEKKPEEKIKRGSGKILFVDDEASVVKLNHQRLERLGYQVKSTTKPVEALEWFKADPDQFDVIITDMTMPRMTGDMLAKEILAIRRETPVIICTGYSERMTEKQAEALGAAKYMEKPIGKENLAKALREVLDENPQNQFNTSGSLSVGA